MAHMRLGIFLLSFCYNTLVNQQSYFLFQDNKIVIGYTIMIYTFRMVKQLLKYEIHACIME